MDEKCENCGAYRPGSRYHFYVGKPIKGKSGYNFEALYDFSLRDSAYICNYCVDKEVMEVYKFRIDDGNFIKFRKKIRDKYKAKTKTLFIDGKKIEIPPSFFWILLYDLFGYKKEDQTANDLCTTEDYKDIGSKLAIQSMRYKYVFNPMVITPREKSEKYTIYSGRYLEY